MKTILLSLSRVEATEKLSDRLATISDTAIKTLDSSACYGDIHEKQNETTFVVGLGPTGFTTAQGKIIEISPEQSELSYKFKGIPWAFLIKDALNSRIKEIFKDHIVKKNKKSQQVK